MSARASRLIFDMPYELVSHPNGVLTIFVLQITVTMAFSPRTKSFYKVNIYAQLSILNDWRMSAHFKASVQ